MPLQSPISPHFRWIKLVLPVGLLVLLTLQSKSPKTAPASVAGPVPGAGLEAKAPAKTVEFPRTLPPPESVNVAFHKWVSQIQAAPAAPHQPTPDVLALAGKRRERMRYLIQEDPRQAIAEGLTFAEWDALPAQVQQIVERPFSVVADLHQYPVCVPTGAQRPEGIPEIISDLAMPDGSHLDAFSYGRRAEIGSKRGIPVQGIALDGMAAIREEVFQRISGADTIFVEKAFPSAQRNAQLSFATGLPVGPGAVRAIGGGQWYTFASVQELTAMSDTIAKLDDLPGPNAGSSVLFYQAFSPDGTGGFDLPAANAYAAEQASAWTETKKTLFLIRANFPDKLPEPVTQAAAAAEINGASSDLIRAMSYGKTWIEGTVSANVYQMPQTAAFYADSGAPDYGTSTFSSKNADLLRDARNTFRTNKSGGDSAINIGPVSSNSNGDGGGLGDYDIVGVFFDSIGMYGGGVGYAGLAGGGNLWVQDANYTSLYVHEWGHNYGIGHSSFWQTSDGSVVGSGSSVEYGDSFDIMGGGPAPEGHFHPQAKAKLNWLTTSEWTDASAGGSGQYRVYREDDSLTTGTPRGLRLTKSSAVGNEEYYWIGYRPAFTNRTHLQRGAYLIWQRPGQSRSWLIDTTPATSGVNTDAPVDLGRTYEDSAAGLFVTPIAVGGTASERYIDVQVNIGPFPGNQAPTASAIAGPSTLPARSTATFSVTAADGDGDPLAYSWDTLDGTVNDNSASLSHSWTVGGTYTIQVTITDMKGGTLTIDKTVTVTDPIDTWTQNTIGTTEDAQEIVWGKGRFIAAEYWGTVFLSWDGVTWENVGDPPTFDSQPKLAFGNDVFVMAGKMEGASAAQIAWSNDGRLWSSASFPAGIPQIRGVTFGDGKFVAVADGGTVLTSTNGADWSLTTVGGTPNFRHVAFDGTTWLAIAMNAGGTRPEVAWTSLDTTNWASHDMLGIDTFRVFAADGVMYALGWYGGVMYSDDHGLTWKDAELPGPTRWTTDRIAKAEDGTLLVTARAMDESGTPRALLVSDDGLHWSRTTENGGNIAVANANALAYGFGKFITVANGGVTWSSAGLYPSNVAPSPSFTINPATGNARQPISFAASATDSNGDPLIYAWDFGVQVPILDGASINPTFAFGGTYTATLHVTDSRGGHATLSHSVTINDPARSFTRRTSGTTNSLQAIATDGVQAVAVGSGGKILTSTDGITWTSRTLSEFTGNITFRGITWDGTQFIAAGQDYNFTIAAWVGLIYTSPDGVTWTRRYRPDIANTALNGITTNGSVSIAVGDSGTVLRSTNSIDWSVVTISGLGTPTVKGVAWGDDVFALTAYSSGNGTGRVFTSSDGSSWVDRSSGIGIASWQDLRKIAWLKDRFVASGWYSSLRTSTDSAQSFTTNRPQTEETPAMAYGDGIFFAAGVNYSNGSADVDLLSQDGVTWYTFAAPTTNDRNGAVFFKHTLITVGQSGEIWQSADLTPPTGYALWQNIHFPAGGLASLGIADPDFDGVSNLLEYALQRSPTDPNIGNGPSGTGNTLMQSGIVMMQLDMPDPAPADITYHVEGTNTLTGLWTTLAEKVGTGPWVWQGGGTTHLIEGTANAGRRSVQIGRPDSSSGQTFYFFHLKVEEP